jgi:hypothetical protein
MQQNVDTNHLSNLIKDWDFRLLVIRRSRFDADVTSQVSMVCVEE